MQKFEIIITEVLERKIYIAGENHVDAKRIAEDLYFDEKIVLDSDNFKEVKFK